jgi:hypothetical protein
MNLYNVAIICISIYILYTLVPSSTFTKHALFIIPAAHCVPFLLDLLCIDYLGPCCICLYLSISSYICSLLTCSSLLWGDGNERRKHICTRKWQRRKWRRQRKFSHLSIYRRDVDMAGVVSGRDDKRQESYSISDGAGDDSALAANSAQRSRALGA